LFYDLDNQAVFEWAVVIGVSLAAALSDLWTRRIPNALTAPVLLVGLLRAMSLEGWSGLVDSVGASFLLALPYVLLFLFANGGAGDAKLMGAIGTWLGIWQGLTVLFCVAAAGIVLALTSALVQKRLKLVLTNVFLAVYTFMVFLAGHRIVRCSSETDSVGQSSHLVVPYGIAIFAGVFAAGGFALLW
jgi:prepilin peptidase CpaA